MATPKSNKKAARKSSKKTARKNSPKDAKNNAQHSRVDATCPADCELGPGKIIGGDKGEPRARLSRDLRKTAADDEYARSFPTPPGTPPHHRCNDDEVLYFNQNFIASFTKGLPHHPNGEVQHDKYCELLRALDSGNPPDFEDPSLLGCPPSSRKLEDPQGGYAFDLEGADSHSLEHRIIPLSPLNSVRISEIINGYFIFH